MIGKHGVVTVVSLCSPPQPSRRFFPPPMPLSKPGENEQILHIKLFLASVCLHLLLKNKGAED